MVRGVLILLLIIAGCTPGLTAPRESVRISGAVTDDSPGPVEVGVYERCTARLFFFKRCPGKLVGQARIPKPGPFLVEIDAESDEVSVVAYRGPVGQESACAVQTLPVGELETPLDLALAPSPCPLALPQPIQASARAPVSGY